MPATDKSQSRIRRDEPLCDQYKTFNQLSYTKEHCRQWMADFDELMKVTRDAAPARSRIRRHDDPYRLQRHGNHKINNKNRERLLEQALWVQWGAEGCRRAKRWFLPEHCKRVCAFQVPLQDRRKDRGWGKVDILAISGDDLPAVGELKKENGGTPLLMLAQAFCYALAIQKAWGKGALKDEWADKVVDGHSNKLPDHIDQLSIFCVAPERYWNTRIGVARRRTAGQVFPEAWGAFSELVAMCGAKGFPVSFVTFDVDEPNDALPQINNPRERPIPKCPHDLPV